MRFRRYITVTGGPKNQSAMFIPNKKMSWEGQELQNSMKEFVGSYQPPPTEQLTMEQLLQQFNDLKQQVQANTTRKAPKARKVTLVSLDAKLDLLINLISQNS